MGTKEFGLHFVHTEPLQAFKRGSNVVRFVFQIEFSGSCVEGGLKKHREIRQEDSRIIQARGMGLSSGK